MGITDKISGRVKQAAGDLAGSDSLRREGKQEERKGEAKDELAREDAKVASAQADADRERARADQRAEAAADREYAKADREQERAEAQRGRADRKASEVDKLEGRTNPDAISAESTKDELYERAQELDIEGRSDMSKDELAEAIRRHA